LVSKTVSSLFSVELQARYEMALEEEWEEYIGGTLLVERKIGTKTEQL